MLNINELIKNALKSKNATERSHAVTLTQSQKIFIKEVDE